MEKLQDKITILRNKGMTYKQIEDELGCSKGTISYHLSQGVKERNVKRTNMYRKNLTQKIKEDAGAKCCICGYDRSFSALEFHHVDPNQKSQQLKGAKNSMRNLMTMSGKQNILDEVDKCLLLCANCHREIHDGTIAVEIGEGS